MKIFVHPSELQLMQRHLNSLIDVSSSEEKNASKERVTKDAYDFLLSYQKIYFPPQISKSHFIIAGLLFLPFADYVISTESFQSSPEATSLALATLCGYLWCTSMSPSNALQRHAEEIKKTYRECKAGLTDLFQPTYRASVEIDISSLKELRKKEDITVEYLIQRYEFILDNLQAREKLTNLCAIS